MIAYIKMIHSSEFNIERSAMAEDQRSGIDGWGAGIGEWGLSKARI